MILELAAKNNIPVLQLAGLNLIPQKYAISIARLVGGSSIKILGIERFFLQAGEAEPDMGGIADFSDVTTIEQSVVETINFLQDLGEHDDVYIEFTLDM